jgi:two-component system sensor histidine kinase KdpD
VADDVIDFARSNNITQIVIGKSGRTRWFELLHGSVVHDLVRRSGNISVHVIAGDALKEEAIPRKTVRTSTPGANVAGYFAALWVTAACTLAAELMKPSFGGETVPLIFMMGVLGVAYLACLGPSILAAVASMLSYNFFFIAPSDSFIITGPINVAALFFFLFTALIVSNLTARVRRQADLARNRAAITSALYGFSSNLASQAKLEDLLSTSVLQIAASLGADVVMMLPDAHGRLKVASSFPPHDVMEKADLGAAQWCFENCRSAGRGSDTLPGARRLFLPLRTNRGAIGVAGLAAGRRSDIILSPDERRLLDALIDQAAVAIERVRLAQEMDDARVAAETERLRGALLTSLSHDLKTPLASILGAAGSLREYGERFDAAARAEMIRTIEDEASRMARFVGNLLDMTRLESGAVELKRQPTELLDVVGAALRRTEGLLLDFKISLDIEPDLPLLELDEMLIEQVLVNLLDNAAKYAPPLSTIAIKARRSGSAVELQVVDEGPGIPEDQLSLIFEKFHRVKGGDHQRAGTGLGLAICRGFVEAMGGGVTAANRMDRSGAIFTVELPVPAAFETSRLPVLA